MTDERSKPLIAVPWPSPEALSRAGEMIGQGSIAAARGGVTPPEAALDKLLFEAGRTRGQALEVIASVEAALDEAADLVPRRAEGAMETDRARTMVERIALLAALAREAKAAREALGLALPLLRRERTTLVECHSTLRKAGGGSIEPVPGTLDEDVIDEVAAYDAAIAAVAAAQKEGRESDVSLRTATTSNGERDESL